MSFRTSNFQHKADKIFNIGGKMYMCHGDQFAEINKGGVIQRTSVRQITHMAQMSSGQIIYCDVFGTIGYFIEKTMEWEPFGQIVNCSQIHVFGDSICAIAIDSGVCLYKFMNNQWYKYKLSNDSRNHVFLENILYYSNGCCGLHSFDLITNECTYYKNLIHDVRTIFIVNSRVYVQDEMNNVHNFDSETKLYLNVAKDIKMYNGDTYIKNDYDYCYTKTFDNFDTTFEAANVKDIIKVDDFYLVIHDNGKVTKYTRNNTIQPVEKHKEVNRGDKKVVKIHTCETLPPIAGIKYCPFCGIELDKLQKIQGFADVIDSYFREHFARRDDKTEVIKEFLNNMDLYD